MFLLVISLFICALNHGFVRMKKIKRFYILLIYIEQLGVRSTVVHAARKGDREFL